MKAVTAAFVRALFPKRPPWSHKGEWGRLLVIGGSRTYSGAPALAALAAYRSGCDLVTVAAPQRAADIAASFSPDMVAHPLSGPSLTTGHVRGLLALADSADAVVIGGGLGRAASTAEAVLHFLRRTALPCVVDADALHAVAHDPSVLRGSFVITPHAQEFFALTGKTVTSNIQQRMRAASTAAKKFTSTVLLKGHYDIISDGKDLSINKTGCPEMAKAGTGDVLAGICGALLSRGIRPFDAACAAAYISGRAGELAAGKAGIGLLASDVANGIPAVLKRSTI